MANCPGIEEPAQVAAQPGPSREELVALYETCLPVYKARLRSGWKRGALIGGIWDGVMKAVARCEDE